MKKIIEALDRLMQNQESDEVTVTMTWLQDLKEELGKMGWIHVNDDTPECYIPDPKTGHGRWSEDVVVFRSTRFQIDVWDNHLKCFSDDDGDPDSIHTAQYWMPLTEPR